MPFMCNTGDDLWLGSSNGNWYAFSHSLSQQDQKHTGVFESSKMRSC